MPRHESSMARLGWQEYLGSDDTLARLWLLGRYPVRVQSVLVEAVEAMETALIATGYEDPTDFIGSYMYRTIGGLDVWSTHAYGTAIDLDYGGDTDGDGDPTIDKNPYLRRPITDDDPGWGVEWQISLEQVQAVEAIRNLDGDPMWVWKGWSIGDTMHWQIGVSPDRASVDWSTVEGWEVANQETSNPAYQESFDKALEAGMYTEYTNVDDITTAEKLAVYLDRIGLIPTAPTPEDLDDFLGNPG